MGTWDFQPLEPPRKWTCHLQRTIVKRNPNSCNLQPSIFTGKLLVSGRVIRNQSFYRNQPTRCFLVHVASDYVGWWSKKSGKMKRNMLDYIKVELWFCGVEFETFRYLGVHIFQIMVDLFIMTYIHLITKWLLWFLHFADFSPTPKNILQKNTQKIKKYQTSI